MIDLCPSVFGNIKVIHIAHRNGSTILDRPSNTDFVSLILESDSLTIEVRKYSRAKKEFLIDVFVWPMTTQKSEFVWVGKYFVIGEQCAKFFGVFDQKFSVLTKS